jgi:hypothetical protein
MKPTFRTALIAAAVLLAGCPPAQAPVAGHRVEVNGMQMYYEVSGAGDPLIVLHGAYMNIPSMGAIIPKLAATHRVYALELQGHGRTTDIDRPITYPNLADDVALPDPCSRALKRRLGSRRRPEGRFSPPAPVRRTPADRFPVVTSPGRAASATAP